MKKICRKCGRNRKIGKFGKDSRKSDGKMIYCRDCVREFNKSYKNTLNGRLKSKKTIEKWKNNNKEAISSYNKDYYKKNRNRILYNKKCRECTESILIFEEDNKKINKKSDIIIINPKRKKDG